MQPQPSQPQPYTLSFLSPYQLPYTNKKNFHTYSPYIFSTQINSYTIDQQWYKNLPLQVQQELKEKFLIGEIRDLEYPHAGEKGYEYWEIYTWYNCRLYDFQRYREEIGELNGEKIELVRFQGNKERAEFSQLFFKENPKIDTLERLNKQLQAILQKNESKKGYFIKLTQRSAKNEMKLFPARTLAQVYKNLLYSMDVKKQIYESSGILLREWQQFQSENSVEFRVFVFERRVIGISPQYFRKKLDWKTVDVGKLVEKLREGVEKIRFMNSFVIDLMWIGNERIWFIEFNPYGTYAASGFALFSLEELLSLEKQVQPPMIKFLQGQPSMD